MRLDPHNLQRFVDAQSPIYDQVIGELRDGQKRTHWMWFVFPQIVGLGQSDMARKYGIQSKAEAAAYLEHELLAERLRECVRMALQVEDRSASEILGQVDRMKFHSSLTLFNKVAPTDEESCFKWEPMMRYLDDAKAQIDNNRAEQAIRPTKLGMKNWLFVGHPDAGKRSAIIYTLVQNCIKHEIDPQEYLIDVLQKLPTCGSDPEAARALQPKHWKQNQTSS